MFNLFKKKQPDPPTDMRDLWFGDVPLSQWRPQAGGASLGEPWTSFENARVRLHAGDLQGATKILASITNQPSLESRHYLEAFHALRELGVAAPAHFDKHLYGVIIEVHQTAGLDVLVAYTDHTARYLNYSGKLIVWETSTPSMNAHIDRLLNQARNILPHIGPWEGPRPEPPPPGQVRINLLTSSGLCFGQGSFDSLAADSMGGPLLGAATQLMTALVNKAMSTSAGASQ